jgi:hypothetical protein
MIDINPQDMKYTEKVSKQIAGSSHIGYSKIADSEL